MVALPLDNLEATGHLPVREAHPRQKVAHHLALPQWYLLAADSVCGEVAQQATIQIHARDVAADDFDEALPQVYRVTDPTQVGRRNKVSVPRSANGVAASWQSTQSGSLIYLSLGLHQNMPL